MLQSFRASRLISNRLPKDRSVLRVAACLAFLCALSTPSGALQCVAEGKPASSPQSYDLIIRGGTVYDGLGGKPYRADVGIVKDRIAAIGDLSGAQADDEIDAKGMAVSPGFINMLSWATRSLIADGRALSDLRQGVTLEVFGEGVSMGPLSPAMKEDWSKDQGDVKYDIAWTTLSEYLEFLEHRGVSPNVASFVGATSLRIHQIGYEDRPPTPAELETMKSLLRTEMEHGALGLGSSLIYAPAFYAKTDELIELSKVAAEYDGLYISHIRSEGNQFLEAVDELLTIARQAGIRAEIYHLKAAGKENWHKLDQALQKVENARREGLQITADMYTYTAGSTGLDAAMPPWVQEGGYRAWKQRLQDPATRLKVIHEMRTPTDKWENLLLAAGSPSKVLLVSFQNDELKPLTGKTLAEVAQMRGLSPEETAIELVIEDGSRVGTVYFLMDEENVKKKLAVPWVSICSDSGAPAPEGVFLKSNPHPRAYGSFIRVLGKYSRDEKVIPLEMAVHKMTALPAENLRIKDRGRLAKGYFADVVVFDPAKVRDHATYEKPHQLATGIEHVLINGVRVIRDGRHTGAKPGRAVWGPGRKVKAEVSAGS